MRDAERRAGLLDGKGWQYRNRSAAIVPEIAFRGRPDRFDGPDGPANLLVMRDKARMVFGVTVDLATPITQIKEIAIEAIAARRGLVRIT